MSPTRAALLAVLLLAGCTKLVDTASLDPLASADGYCRARYDAHYRMAVRCWGYDPAWAAARPLYWYEEDCDRTAASVAAGRMTYDRAAGEACLAAYEASCTEPLFTLADCKAALAPAVVQGGACTRQQECVAPGGCSSPDSTCPGHCTGFGGQGDACDGAAGPCGPGLWCDAGACAPRRRSGEACAGNCLENLSCDAGFCSYVAGPGEACGALACDPFQPLACVGGTCQHLPAFGEACAGAGQCQAGLYCGQVDGLCHFVPTAPQADGLPCAPPAFCGPASYCDTSLATPACAPRKPLGVACQFSDECQPPNPCDTSGPPSGWSCQPPRVAGSPCVPGACAQGAWCHVETGTTGTCVTEADLGQPCGTIGIGDGTGCLRGYCATAAPGDPVGSCRPLQAGGAPCLFDQECRSSSCDPVAGTCRAEACPTP